MGQRQSHHLLWSSCPHMLASLVWISANPLCQKESHCEATFASFMCPLMRHLDDFLFVSSTTLEFWNVCVCPLKTKASPLQSLTDSHTPIVSHVHTISSYTPVFFICDWRVSNASSRVLKGRSVAQPGKAICWRKHGSDKPLACISYLTVGRKFSVNESTADNTEGGFK